MKAPPVRANAAISIFSASSPVSATAPPGMRGACGIWNPLLPFDCRPAVLQNGGAVLLLRPCRGGGTQKNPLFLLQTVDSGLRQVYHMNK